MNRTFLQPKLQVKSYLLNYTSSFDKSLNLGVLKRLKFYFTTHLWILTIHQVRKWEKANALIKRGVNSRFPWLDNKETVESADITLIQCPVCMRKHKYYLVVTRVSAEKLTGGLPIAKKLLWASKTDFFSYKLFSPWKEIMFWHLIMAKFMSEFRALILVTCKAIAARFSIKLEKKLVQRTNIWSSKYNITLSIVPMPPIPRFGWNFCHFDPELLVAGNVFTAPFPCFLFSIPGPKMWTQMGGSKLIWEESDFERKQTF